MMFFSNQIWIIVFNSLDQHFSEFSLYLVLRIIQPAALCIGLCFAMIASNEKDHDAPRFLSEIVTYRAHLSCQFKNIVR